MDNSNNISVSVPYDYLALMGASEMFKCIAESIPGAKAPTQSEAMDTVIEKASDNTGLPKEELVAPTPQPEDSASAAQVFEDASPTLQPTQSEDVDARGMPWDSRIHAGTKSKLVNGDWKNKRGIDVTVLAEVEAELMGRPAQALTPLVNEVADSSGVDPEYVPLPPVASKITSFPELMAEITTKQINPKEVVDAVNKVGLESLPLLATRADLVPQVAAELGL